MVATIKVEKPFFETHGRLSEGPLYDHRTNVLYWLDIIGETVHWVDYSKIDEGQPAVWATHKWITTGTPIGVIGLTQTKTKLFSATKTGFAFLDLSNAKGNGDRVEPQYAARVHVSEEDQKLRFNDGFVDPHGRFMVGSMFTFDGVNEHKGKVYRYDAALSIKTGKSQVEILQENCQIPNGTAFSPDLKYMYYIDSMTSTIFRYDYDNESGKLSNMSPFIRVEIEGIGAPEPDGMCTSEDGSLWVAVWGSSTLRRFSDKGELLEVYEFPAKRVSCPAFAGPDLDDLIVTTANLYLENAKDAATFRATGADLGGDVFRIKIPGVKGTKRFILNA